MSSKSKIVSILACPRCDKALELSDGADLSCTACKVSYPQLNDIPFLFSEPEAALGEWRGRLHFLLQKLERDAEKICVELKEPNLLELTRQRLELLCSAYRSHAGDLKKLLAPLELDQLQATHESYLALRTRLPSDQALNTYYANIHRDWEWGSDENERSANLVTEAINASDHHGTILVLGAGAGRLAYDLHSLLNTELTVALDFNPMLLLIAQRVMRGETIELHEFPIAPATIADSARLGTLAAPAPVGKGFEYVLGDALRPPFSAGSFNIVITPWLVDILPTDLERTAAEVNRLLKPEGQWICFGSLSFARNRISRCYSLEESLAVIQQNGFKLPDARQDEIPYMHSPYSRHARQEKVITISATKSQDVPRRQRYTSLPDWLVTGNDPVPQNQSFQAQAMSTRIHAFIMSMIDGKRSLRDMALLMEQQRLMPQEEAQQAIRSFLIKMYEESQRSTEY